MTEKEKIDLVADLLDVDAEGLHAGDTLANIENWDSQSMILMIFEMENSFHKKLDFDKMKTFKTVQDILDLME